jgi:hypothetical protein
MFSAIWAEKLDISASLHEGQGSAAKGIARGNDEFTPPPRSRPSVVVPRRLSTA